MMSSEDMFAKLSATLAGDLPSDVVFPLPLDEERPRGVLGFGIRE